jgi:pilus assembly protein CpaE
MSSGSKEVIKVLIVDDIPDTRENLRKLLAFETDIQVVGVAGTGVQAVELASQLKPDVVLMDINMPDMDGITATKKISAANRSIAVVIMSVQSDSGYLRQAMHAGANDFLTKPISSEELYTTIRRAYERNDLARQQDAQMASVMRAPSAARIEVTKSDTSVTAVGAGHIIVVYSPQGGSGTTTVATNMASALMRQDTRVLLVDCNLQFGDVDAFLNIQAQSTIANLTKVIDLEKGVNDIDQDMINNVLVTHPSGLKVLVAPSDPEQAYDINPDSMRELILSLASSFDFVIVDTATQYDAMTLKLFEVAEKIVLVSNPTIPAVRNTKKMLDIFEILKDPSGLLDKVIFVLNRVISEKDRKGIVTLSASAIESHLRVQIATQIPDDRNVVATVNQGVTLIAKMKTQSPAREIIMLAEVVRQSVSSGDEPLQINKQTAKSSGLGRLMGGKS